MESKNNLYSLKGKWHYKQGEAQGNPNIPTNGTISLAKLIQLKISLNTTLDYWNKQNVNIHFLITAYYKMIIAKSHRMKNIIKDADKYIVGAKFLNNDNGRSIHAITYCIDKKQLLDSLQHLELAINLWQSKFNQYSEFNYELIENISNKKYENLFKNGKISRTAFVKDIVDAYYLDHFGVELNTKEFITEPSLISLYDIHVDPLKFFEELNIKIPKQRKLNDNTIYVYPEEYKKIQSNAPYLISMAVNNQFEMGYSPSKIYDSLDLNIPEPKSEPIIGVIDTPFNKKAYFSKWVEDNSLIDKNIEIFEEDYFHGTAVSSIIVDGPRLNPNLNDGCGRFRVRHFGVALKNGSNSFTIVKAIQNIVIQNRDIKVWNLSLGSIYEINDNFISPEAAVLDKIQFENDVIFVISGTNKNPNNKSLTKIGAPADSINSLVVNAANFAKKPTNYSREGNVLSFFNKPDISYYGGEKFDEIYVCGANNIKYGVCGTSFAAPWIARKMAYLIHIMGIPREVAKALLIHCSTNWNKNNFASKMIGYGVVPININDIVYCPTDEIRFFLYGNTEMFETYNYNIPLPIVNNKQPFIAKTTLCYFPNCSRSNGVDYTNIEMDIHFGRILINKNGKPNVKTIDNNIQSEEETKSLYESDARTLYRKWDNIKHVSEVLTTNNGQKKKAKKVMTDYGLWGLNIKTKQRNLFSNTDERQLNFGIVISFKEIYGKNRIEQFLQQAHSIGWIINKIDVDQKINIYEKVEEDLKLN